MHLQQINKCFTAFSSPLLGPKHVVVKFVVKFFPPDHTQLQEELTRLVVWKLVIYCHGVQGRRESSCSPSTDDIFSQRVPDQRQHCASPGNPLLPALLTQQERKHHVFLETWFLESYAVKGTGLITSHRPDFRLLSITSQDGLGKSNSVTCCRGWVGMTQCSVSLKVGPVGERGS